MKVLVYFEQEFLIKAKINIRTIEKISHVFEVDSKTDLLRQFQCWIYIPNYLKNISKNIIEIQSGRRTMLWYLPETFEPHF